MAIPTYGAKPVALTFLAARGLQLVFLFIIIGLTSNFVNSMVMANHNPSTEIVGALVITCIATLYTLVSISFFWASAHTGMFYMAGIDGLIFIAMTIVSITIGKPIAPLNCYWRFENLDGSVLEGLQANWNMKGSTVDLEFWSGMNKSNCFETKAIWGFCIALTILYFTTALLLPMLHLKNRKAGFVKADV